MQTALIVLAAAIVLAAVILVLGRRRAEPTHADPRLDHLLQSQGDIAGQFKQTVAAQTALSDRMDALNNRLSQSLSDSATKTAATISGIGERLSAIDEAQ